MPAWTELGPADFDARKADKRALRQARQDAARGQAGLFHVSTPAREIKRAPDVPEQLPGQSDLFSDGE